MTDTITTIITVLTDDQIKELYSKAIDNADRDLLGALHAENIRRAQAENDAANERMRAEHAARQSAPAEVMILREVR